jgi:hypothetical protein
MVIEAGNADILGQAVAADNQGYVQAFVEDGRLIAFVEADSVGSMLATLDDLLVNLKVADEVLGGHGAIEGQED